MFFQLDMPPATMVGDQEGGRVEQNMVKNPED